MPLKRTFGALIFCLFLVMQVNSCSPVDNEPNSNQPNRSIEDRLGARFFPISEKYYKAPRAEEVDFLRPHDGASIWGATGRDNLGKIYFGVSTHGSNDRTAYLFQYDPSTNSAIPQSDVLSQLKRLNLYKPEMGQNKLHSKIYQANDGYLYFSSFDEAGETSEISPYWGGHLWRKMPESENWEHVLATEEALIAVNTTGRYVYSLGYWGHVLYQFDTLTQEVKKVVVGAVKGHISRNFLVDLNEHVYIPRVILNDLNEINVSLVEYTPQLLEVASYPMPSYQQEDMHNHHGIIAYTPMLNGDIFFTTSEGTLYQLKSLLHNTEKLQTLGQFSPEGPEYIPSLFSPDGVHFLVGVVTGNPVTWLIREAKTETVVSYPLLGLPEKFWLYGTATSDNSGNFYLGGTQITKDDKYLPAIIRLVYPLNIE